MTNYQEIIEQLQLQKHPEGGYFKEIYRSEESIHQNALPKRYLGARNISTFIYFMLTENDISAFHRIKSDEIWHHYMGDDVELLLINASGELERHLLGKGLKQGALPQVVIPKDHWFAGRVVPGGSYCLMGCTVAPGFDFEDFELADRAALTQEFPDLEETVVEFTYQ